MDKDYSQSQWQLLSRDCISLPPRVVEMDMDSEHFNYSSLLEQLWNAAVAIFPISPALSQLYMRKLFRVAHNQQITLSNSLYWNACSHCGCLWYPSITCNPAGSNTWPPAISTSCTGGPFTNLDTAGEKYSVAHSIFL